MPTPKKLIEVALPIKEISAESVRDKSIRHGHISTLHLWWARRPLPVCRAVVFASLVPDPLDDHCPPAFREAVEVLLGGGDDSPGDPYKPYDDIPYTVAVDRMDDTLRNRLLMFIGKFSEKFVHNEKLGKATPAKDLLSDASLIKWDNKNNEAIINKARKLIFVSHQAGNAGVKASATELMQEFDDLYAAIKTAEKELYGTPDRHLSTPGVIAKETALHDAIEAFLDKMPRVFDPFAGGGAIPLEAARLGCRSYGNDINPVAHIIQKGSLEFPQKYGKPITYSREEFIGLYGEESWNQQSQNNKILQKGEATAIRIPNRLSFDVEYFAKKLLAETEKEIGHVYPADKKGIKPLAYYWARVGTCSNPSCKTKIPLLKGFYLANKKDKQVYLKTIINGNEIDFSIHSGETLEEGFVHSRKNLRCPVCGNNTSNAELKKQFLSGQIRERLIAVIEDSDAGKTYRLPTKEETEIVDSILVDPFSVSEKIAVGNTKQFDLCPWGYIKFPGFK